MWMKAKEKYTKCNRRQNLLPKESAAGDHWWLQIWSAGVTGPRPESSSQSHSNRGSATVTASVNTSRVIECMWIINK